MLEKSESNGEEFVVDTLGNFEPMQGTEVWSDMVVLWDFADDSGIQLRCICHFDSQRIPICIAFCDVIPLSVSS
mgnify:CR=1 FL=1